MGVVEDQDEPSPGGLHLVQSGSQEHIPVGVGWRAGSAREPAGEAPGQEAPLIGVG
jgi:hypothetical protein